MPRADKNPGPKPDKAKWTDSKVRFILNEFLTEKENGHLMGTTWKPAAFVNVTASYNLAYSNEPLTVRQIKNCYSSKKSIYTAAKKLKDNTGIGWVEGECRIDMPQEWWNDEGMKHKDALQFQKHLFIFFDQMDELLHFSKPAGALRTGTSSNAQVKANRVENQEEVEVEDEDDRVGTKACDIRKQDGDLSQEIVVIDKGIVLDGADSSETTVCQDKAEETTNPTEPKSNKKPPASDDSDNSISLVKPAKTNNKKKMPAREVKPGTLANAIATASTDSVIRTQKLLNSKATRSAERDAAIEAAARIRSERHAHQQEAISIFNMKSEVEFPDVQDRLIAIDVIADEREASLFAGLNDEMAWIWLKNQVVKEKKKLGQDE
ncbi:hypothetical protein DFH28DRAFT_1201605 [Melampsora americana]|nr:hypothetical protein DFH28DRAFT_1201605 [Melampsora americana]